MDKKELNFIALMDRYVEAKVCYSIKLSSLRLRNKYKEFLRQSDDESDPDEQMKEIEDELKNKPNGSNVEGRGDTTKDGQPEHTS